MIDPPVARPGQRILSGPQRAGSQLRWQLELPGGQRAVLVQLVPELANEESVRRRYVYEAERLSRLEAPSIAPTLAVGPSPDPRDPSAESPWRLRVDPDGETLAAWLARRAPAPVDEVLALVASIADAIHGVHVAGAVLRDLEPRGIVLGAGGAVWLTDIGLARVDILSTRTASSLMLETSPYAAPEHLRSTLVNQRADIYTLGAIAWHALVGEPPFSAGPIRAAGSLPSIAALAPAVPAAIAEMLDRCLADAPDARPDSARDVAEVLRGRPLSATVAMERVVCQACGELLRPGLRLCLSCGREAVRFQHAGDDVRQRYAVVLKTARDDVEFLGQLRELFEQLGEGPPPELNFLIGDARMYSKKERQQLQRLPAVIFDDLSRQTASDLADLMRARGMKVRVSASGVRRRARRRGRLALLMGGMTSAVAVALIGSGASLLGGLLLVGGGAVALGGGISALVHRKRPERRPMAHLRAAPAALPASDPLVARVAAPLAAASLAPDLRERISELALLVQRLVDHRADHLGDADVALLTEPVEPLVALIERELAALAAIDSDLAELDEGTLVRALAASEARGEAQARRAELLAGLDRLRALEDQRSTHMQRLLEATSLVRRSVELGLAQQGGDGDAALDRELALALTELDAEL